MDRSEKITAMIRRANDPENPILDFLRKFVYTESNLSEMLNFEIDIAYSKLFQADIDPVDCSSDTGMRNDRCQDRHPLYGLSRS